MSAGQLIALVREQSMRLQTLSGTGSISFESPTMSGSASFEVSLKKPDSLLALFEGPFGVDVGSILLSRDRFFLYNSHDNALFTGKPEASTLRKLIPFDLSFDELLRAFSGSFSLPDSSSVIAGYRIDEGRFLVSTTCGKGSSTYWIDNQVLHVTEYEMRDEQGDLLIHAVWSSFAEEDGVSAPKRMAIWFPRENRQISLSYSSIAINPPHPSFAYSYPSDAKTYER
jgi:hypothetical protein